MPFHPRLTWPLALTLFRLLMVPVFLTLLIYGSTPLCRWTAVALFGLMAATDKLDGYLARRFDQVTRLGTLLDPAADKLLVTAATAMLMSPRLVVPAELAIPWPLAVGIYLKDFGVLLGIGVVIAKVGRVKLSARRSGKWSTTAQLSLVMATLLVPDWIAISPAFAATFLWAIWYVTLAATAAAGISYSIEGARQLRAHSREQTAANAMAAPPVASG